MDREVSRRRLIGGLGGSLVMGARPAGPAIAANRAGTSVQLPIPPRLQWEERGGYCGESCVQQAALTYGTYISQFACRELVGRGQRQPFLVAMNDRRVLKSLRLGADEFAFSQYRTPQFEAYFTWTKEHLAKGHPVIITAFGKYLRDPDYDHIMLATGFEAESVSTFSEDDVLVFNDCFTVPACRRSADSLSDDRKMRRNGRQHEFCIPTRVDFGCAITGIVDETGQLLPVSLALEGHREPNVIAGASPRPLDLTVHITDLVAGQRYALYRYDNHRNVPTRDYAESNYDSIEEFTASSATEVIRTTVQSDGIATFRCLPM